MQKVWLHGLAAPARDSGTRHWTPSSVIDRHEAGSLKAVATREYPPMKLCAAVKSLGFKPALRGVPTLPPRVRFYPNLSY